MLLHSPITPPKQMEKDNRLSRYCRLSMAADPSTVGESSNLRAL